MAAPKTVRPGMKFLVYVADGQDTFEVVEKDGRTTWLCRGLPSYHNGVDCAYSTGQTRAFTTQEILTRVQWADHLDQIVDTSEKWWDERQVGEIVHYHNSFGRFVRGVVVPQVIQGHVSNCFRPFALVGAWKPLDLPRRGPDGEIKLGEGGRSLEKTEGWRPHASSMYEFPEAGTARKFGDPNELDNLDISVPEPTDEQRRLAGLLQIRKEVIDALSHPNCDERDRSSVFQALSKAKSLLDGQP